MHLNNLSPSPTFTPTRTPKTPTFTVMPTATETPITPAIPAGQTWKFYYFAGAQRIAIRYKYAGSINQYGFLLSDHLGSTSILVSLGGVQEAKLLYKAFGEERLPSTIMPTNYRFTGQLSQMTDTGLYYYGARWYDPGIRTLHPGGQHHPAAGQPAGLGSVRLCAKQPCKF